MAAPAWAKRFIDKVLAGENADRLIQIGPPTLVWRKSKIHRYSSGHFSYVSRRLVVTAGTDRTDAKVALLHEATHMVQGWDGRSRSAHAPSFYEEEFRLAKKYGVPIRSVLHSEVIRKPRNTRAGYRQYRRSSGG